MGFSLPIVNFLVTSLERGGRICTVVIFPQENPCSQFYRHIHLKSTAYFLTQPVHFAAY